VRRDEAVTPDQRRQVGRVGELEEHRAGADRQGDRDHDLHGERARPGQQRDGRQQRGAGEVRADHHRPPAAPVDPHARRKAEQEVRGRAGRGEQPHLSRPGVEVQGGGQRQRDEPHLGAEHGRRLAAPQLQEVRPDGRGRAGRGLRELDSFHLDAHRRTPI
jgi:hypothetical protein